MLRCNKITKEKWDIIRNILFCLRSTDRLSYLTPKQPFP